MTRLAVHGVLSLSLPLYPNPGFLSVSAVSAVSGVFEGLEAPEASDDDGRGVRRLDATISKSEIRGAGDGKCKPHFVKFVKLR